jgi:hypothetical protein
MSTPAHSLSPDLPLTRTQHWVAEMVVGLNLCPFARAEMVNQRIRYVLVDSPDPQDLLHSLERELIFLQAADRSQTETTLIVCSAALPDFMEMQLFLPHGDALLKRLGLRGQMQIASFHPDFVFASSSADDPANASNRSPYPTLHLIREDAIARAAASMDDPDSIYEANIALLRQMGAAAIAQRMSMPSIGHF